MRKNSEISWLPNALMNLINRLKPKNEESGSWSRSSDVAKSAKKGALC
jgi:hypothetical protein